MCKQGKIVGVSLGPGDPSLITVKGLQTLLKADRIYYPGSIHADGSTSSYSYNILKHHGLDESKWRGMFLKMSVHREEAEKTYACTFEKMQEDYRNGLTIAVVSEGDISFYSSFAYLLKRIHEHGLQLEMIAGVSSFLSGASANHIPLAIQEEKIAILPNLKTLDALEQHLKDFETVVLIKVNRIISELIPFIQQRHLRIAYCERLGTEQQFITDDIGELKTRDIPYFSLLIIKRS
jgi:precorrin-2/cobalt-factor-2 C20-methyltransferase